MGRVLYVFPELNVYAVQPRDGLVFADEIAYVLAIDVSAHACTSRVGVSDGSSYAPGSEVLLMSLGPSNMDGKDEEGFDLGLYFFILGPSYFNALTSSKTFINDILDDPFIDFFNNQIRNAMSKSMVASELIQDRSFGRPNDSTAGDWIKTNMFGGQLRLTMMRAAVGASSRAQMQFSALDDSIDTIASRLSVQSDAMHHTEYPAWDDFNRVYRYARTKSEGLGTISAPFKLNTEEEGYIYEVQEEDQQGIFRQVAMNGPLVEGGYDLYSFPESVYEDGKVRQISQTDDPPFGLSAIQRTYDGNVSIQSVKNVGMTRSAYVWCPRELDIEDNNPVLNDLGELPPPAANFATTVNIPVEEQSDYASLIKDHKNDYGLQRYLHQIEDKASHPTANLWKTYDKEAIGKKYGEIEKIETELQPLADNKNGYESTPSVEIPDPLLPDEKIKLQALLSCIELDETGAVYLHDGFGSEIKFSRGNIELRPAADLKIFPGRSVIAEVPRDTIVRSRKYVEISSDQNDVLIKSQRDMKLLSGNGGDTGGVLTLENRSTLPFNAANRSTEARSGGIAIKSYIGDLSITAPNIYMGLFSQEDISVKGRAKLTTGTLSLDSGKGVLSATGANMINEFTESITNIAAEKSLLSLDSSGVVVAGSLMGISCPSVLCGPVSDAVNYPSVDSEQGVAVKTLAINTKQVTLKVAGSVKANTGTFSSSCLSDFMSANTVTAANGSFGNASDTSGLIGGSGPGGALRIGEITIITRPLVGILRGATTVMRQSILGKSGVGKTGFTGYGILYTGFFYQQENTYDTKGLVEARYQRMLRKGGGSVKYWDEGAKAGEDMAEMPETVHKSGDVTEAWPGTKAENTYKIKTIKINDDGSVESEDKGSFREAYIINTPK